MEKDLRTIGQRIAFARTRKGLTQDDLASGLGVKQQAVVNWEKDKNGSKLLHEIAILTGVSVEWLRTGENMNTPFLQSNSQAEGLHEKAPVYGYASGATNTFRINDGEAIGYRMKTPYMGPAGFFVITHGDSMEPLFEEGDEVEVNPDMPLAKGKPCVIETINNEALLKIFVSRNERELVYRQLNPPEEKKITMQNYVNVYRVVGKRF